MESRHKMSMQHETLSAVTWDTEVELNSSETAATSMMREEPRQRPARVKLAEAAMNRCVLGSVCYHFDAPGEGAMSGRASNEGPHEGL